MSGVQITRKSSGGGGTVTFPAFTSTQTVFVRKDGNDTTGDGGLLKPYLTIAKALSVITDAATGKRYVISVGPGTFAEASLAIKPWVWLRGCGESQGGPSRLTVTGNAVTLDAAFATGSAQCGFIDINCGGSTGFNFDLVALGSTGATTIEFQDVGCNGNVVLKANNTGDIIDAINFRVFGTTSIDGGNALCKNCYLVGNVSLLTTVISAAADFVGSELISALSLTCSGGRQSTVGLINTSVSGTVTVDQALSSLTVDASSRPLAASLVQTNGGVVANRNDAAALNYTPVTAGHWVSQPTAVKSALDNLASNIIRQPLILAVKNLAVATAGSPQDIGTVTIPAGITRFAVFSSLTQNLLGACAVAESGGSMAAAAFTVNTAAAGGGTAVVESSAGLVTTGTSIGLVQALEMLVVSGVTTLHVRQEVNSANAGTASFYITIFPLS
jgi:hypothetical protein